MSTWSPLSHSSRSTQGRRMTTGPLPTAQPPTSVVSAVSVASVGDGGWEILIPEAMLNKILVNASRALQVDRCSLALYDRAAGELVTVAALPPPQETLRRTRFRPGEGIAGEVARTRQPVKVTDVEHDPHFKRLDRDSIRSLICAPLLDNSSVLGTMTAASNQINAFDDQQLELLTVFADQAALAIVQAHRAEEVDRLKSAFLSTVSHELRTPLNSIRGFVDIILSGRTGPLNPLQLDFLQSVQESTKQLHRLVEDIMQLSLAEAGQLRLECLPTGVEELVLRATRQLRPQAESAGVVLEVAMDEGLPAIECDAARIEQVLLNLVGNAIKFTPAGGHVVVRATASAGGLSLSIQDTGPGIPPEEQARIFDRLYQVQHGLNRGYGGCGLGLTIVKHLVEGHGGRVTVTSQLGHGSTFAIWLPEQFSPPSSPS